MIDEFAKSPTYPFIVIPAKAGIQMVKRYVVNRIQIFMRIGPAGQG